MLTGFSGELQGPAATPVLAVKKWWQLTRFEARLEHH